MNRHLTGKQKFAFGFGAIGKDAIFNIVSVFLMFYITDIVGLSPAFVGVMLFVARIDHRSILKLNKVAGSDSLDDKEIELQLQRDGV